MMFSLSLVTVTGLLVSPVLSLGGSCGTVCTCQAESAVCQPGDLDNIPNDLSPYIRKLQLAGNKIKYVSNMEHYMR